MTTTGTRSVVIVSLIAAGIGFGCGAGLALIATSGGFGIAQGYFMVIVGMVVLGSAAFALERLHPRSGWPVLVLILSTLLAAGPLGLYYLLPGIALITPVALFRALAQKRELHTRARSAD